MDDLWEKRIAVMGSEPCLNSLLIQLKSVLQVGGESDSSEVTSIIFYFNRLFFSYLLLLLLSVSRVYFWQQNIFIY